MTYPSSAVNRKAAVKAKASVGKMQDAVGKRDMGLPGEGPILIPLPPNPLQHPGLLSCLLTYYYTTAAAKITKHWLHFNI